MKAVEFIVEALSWLNIFIVPAAFLSGAGFLVYHHYATISGLVFFIMLAMAGIALGLFWAERVRKTIGCSTFMSRIFYSGDVDGK